MVIGSSSKAVILLSLIAKVSCMSVNNYMYLYNLFFQSIVFEVQTTLPNTPFVMAETVCKCNGKVRTHIAPPVNKLYSSGAVRHRQEPAFTPGLRPRTRTQCAKCELIYMVAQ